MTELKPIDYEYLAGYRDAVAYDLEDSGYVADIPLTQRLAQAYGGPLMDLACGTGTMAIRLAQQGYAVTGVDIIPEMIERAKQKAEAEKVSIKWMVADGRDFHLNQQFPFIYMLGNAFQHFLTRTDQEALLARVREHLQPDGCFLFGTRNPSPRNLFEARFADPQTYPTEDGGKLVATENQQYDAISQVQHYNFLNQWYDAKGNLTKEESSKTALRYVFPQEMEALLHYNGLQIREGYGNWEQEPLNAGSKYMIYVCGRRE